MKECIAHSRLVENTTKTTRRAAYPRKAEMAYLVFFRHKVARRHFRLQAERIFHFLLPMYLWQKWKWYQQAQKRWQGFRWAPYNHFPCSSMDLANNWQQCTLSHIHLNWLEMRILTIFWLIDLSPDHWFRISTILLYSCLGHTPGSTIIMRSMWGDPWKQYRNFNRCKMLQSVGWLRLAISIIRELHWLPVPFDVQFKLLVRTYKGLYGQALGYLKYCLLQYVPARPSCIIIIALSVCMVLDKEHNIEK